MHSGQSSQRDQLVRSCAPATSRVTRSFGSDKLYIVSAINASKCIQRIRCVTDVRSSQGSPDPTSSNGTDKPSFVSSIFVV